MTDPNFPTQEYRFALGLPCVSIRVDNSMTGTEEGERTGARTFMIEIINITMIEIINIMIDGEIDLMTKGGMPDILIHTIRGMNATAGTEIDTIRESSMIVDLHGESPGWRGVGDDHAQDRDLPLATQRDTSHRGLTG